MPKSWFIIHTYSGFEKKVAEGLIQRAKAHGVEDQIGRIEIPTESAHEAVVAFLIARYKRLRTYDRMYGAHWEFQRDGRYGLIPYEEFGNRTLVFWNWWCRTCNRL